MRLNDVAHVWANCACEPACARDPVGALVFCRIYSHECYMSVLQLCIYMEVFLCYNDLPLLILGIYL